MVDERRKRIPQPWLWALAGVALVGVFVFVFVVVPSLLIRAPKTGLSAADELKARNDVRATLVQALAGLAVAGGLVVTYRTYQQNRQEQDRTYERELYAKAVEQLGHEKAPVRLGALYSLERLAEDKPERRQIIVDVICAYLRMPFSPGPAIKPEPEGAEGPEVPAAEAQRWPEGTGDVWQQERQVRLTAQHILADHLGGDRARDQRSTDPLGPHFWPGIRLNLAGAALIDFKLEGVVAGADFRKATFTGDAWFGLATFTDSAEFTGATFTGDAGFVGATFTGAGFDEATFTGRANFSGATFTGNVWFDKATFTCGAWFSLATFTAGSSFPKATFTGGAWFIGTKFTRAAEFGGATFTGGAGFIGATFTGDAEFGGATFTGGAGFGGATFTGDAKFGGATFTGDVGFIDAKFTHAAEFGGATFTGDAGFGGATFTGGESSLSFELSRVVSREAAHIWPTGWRLGADGSGGYTVVRADDGLDTGFKPDEPPAAGTAGGERTS